MSCVDSAKYHDERNKVVVFRQIKKERPGKSLPAETSAMIAMFNAIEKSVGIAAASGVFIASTHLPYISESAEGAP